MKKTTVCFAGLMLIFSILNCSRDDVQDLTQEAPLSFYCTPELYDLASEWAGVYSKLNPGVNIEVYSSAGALVPERLEGDGKLGFLSDEYDSALYAGSVWKVVVGRDVVVPVINAGNPFMDEIYLKGISPAALAMALKDPGTLKWGAILGNELSAPVSLYVLDDPAIQRGMSKFLGAGSFEMNGVAGSDPVDLVAMVQSDPYAIGICRITNVLDPFQKGLVDHVKLLPIDKNGNGTIDFKEDVYADMDLFSRGVWLGKYPRALASNIYSVSGTTPSGMHETAFLKWILTDGQVLLDNHGISDLESSERLASVKLIDGTGNPAPGDYAIPTEPNFFTAYFPMLLALAIVLAFLSIPGISYLRSRKSAGQASGRETRPVFDVGFVQSLPGLYYDKSHTWAFMDQDGLVRIGIDDFLQHVTGPLTRVKMMEAGQRIKKGKKVLSIIQDGKQLDICAPVSGTIREQNKLLNTNTTVLNSSPYSEGWVYKIEPAHWLSEIRFLIMGSGYREWLKTEFQRLKEFLTDTLRSDTVASAHVLQDGGELKDRILEDLGPEVWEDFQTNFIDQSA